MYICYLHIIDLLACRSEFKLILCFSGCPFFKLWWSYDYIPEKAMAPHSSTLACKIPWMEKPGSL